MIMNGEGEGVMLSTPVSPNVEELNTGKKHWIYEQIRLIMNLVAIYL